MQNKTHESTQRIICTSDKREWVKETIEAADVRTVGLVYAFLSGLKSRTDAEE